MEGWSVADDNERATNPMVGRNDRLLPWEKLPGSIDPASIENLRVFSAETSAERSLPPYLRELSRLVDLIIPSTIVPSLRPEFLPDSVRALRVDSEKGVTRFPDRLAFTTIEELSGQFPILFHAGAFPSLQFIHLRLDKKRTMLKNSALPTTLKAMGIGPFNDPCIFEDLNVFELEWLAAYGTRSVSTIERIGQLEGLEALRLFEFPRLTNLEPLLALKSLKELEICWCSRIVDFGPLLHLDSLEKVEFYFCDVKSVDSIRPVLKAKGIKMNGEDCR